MPRLACNPAPLAQWAHRIKCVPCSLAPPVAQYIMTLERAGYEQEAQMLYHAGDSESARRIASAMDAVKSRVDKSTRTRLLNIDCDLQTHPDKYGID